MEGSNEQQQSQQPESASTDGAKSESDVPAGVSGQPQQPETQQQPLTSSNEALSAIGVTAETATSSEGNQLSNEPAAEAPEDNSAAELQQQVDVSDDLDSVAEPQAPADLAPGSMASLMTSNGMNRMTSHEMDLAELKVKIICQEKNNAALKMELKCAELQVAAKEKLDVKKTRLIELLDAKLTAVEKKNVRLVEMMEQVLRDKDTHSHRLMDATKNMEDLSKRLVESERGRQEMRRINNELKTMLDNVEGKGTQIARLAKEKVLKFKTENERIQRELDDLKADGEGASAETAADGTNVDSVDKNSSFTDAVASVETLYRQLDALVVQRDWQLEQSVDGLRAALVEVVRISGELRPAVEQLLVVGAAADRVATVTDRETATKADREKLYKAEIETKNSEIVALKDELSRLKSAIGQLVGLNLGALAAAGPAVSPVVPSSE